MQMLCRCSKHLMDAWQYKPNLTNSVCISFKKMILVAIHPIKRQNPTMCHLISVTCKISLLCLWLSVLRPTGYSYRKKCITLRTSHKYVVTLRKSSPGIATVTQTVGNSAFVWEYFQLHTNAHLVVSSEYLQQQDGLCWIL